MAVTKPTLPQGVTSLSDLLSQIGKVDISNIYAGVGKLSSAEITTLTTDKTSLETGLASGYEEIGELADKSLKMESKSEKLKTRHYQIEGKRTNTVSVTIVGMSEEKKNWLEEQSAKMTQLTMVAVSKEKDQAVLLNGLRWTVDWSGEADGLYTQVITTEFTGKTKDKISFFNNIPESIGG